jgi:preprotein translocase subunit SecB
MPIDFERYEFLKHHVQLKNVCLHELECRRSNGQDNRLNLSLERAVGEVYEENKIKIYLKATIHFDDHGPFTLTCIHEGICESDGQIGSEEFVQFSHDQIVPLLLPYARECIASTLLRMQVPPYIIPTLDTLQSMSLNHGNDIQE